MDHPLTAFSTDTAQALPGPPWLTERRQIAAAEFATRALPTADDEIWRYTRINDLDLARYEPRTAADERPVPAAARAVADDVDACVVVHVVDGVLAAVEGDLPDGLTVASAIAGGDVVADLVGSVTRSSQDPFGLANDAFAPDPVVVSVADGVVVRKPIVVVSSVSGEADGEALFPRLVVSAGETSEATVLEREVGDASALSLPVVEIRAGAASNLRYQRVQQLGSAVWNLAHVTAAVERDANLVLGLAALGGDFARVRADVELVGRGAHADLLAVYFGEGTQMHDFRTLQDHAAPHTTSNLLFKGAVVNKAHSVYSGLIRVQPDARGTAAHQTNRIIKLSDDAWAESVPNLEIENNEVQCSHASAVGPVDPEHLFYLESRGVPADTAERLIVLGFFDEVLRRMPVAELADRLRVDVAAKLSRREA